jgi:hypothetical protein
VKEKDELYGWVVAVSLKFLVPIVTCSEVEARNFTALEYSVLFNAGKRMLKMAENL